MSSAKANPQQPLRGKTKSHAKPAKEKATATASLKNSQVQTRSRQKAFTSQNVPSALSSAEPVASDRDQELLQIQSLLAQIWHRNKNQHRGQKWWKWVSVLKGRIRDLIELVGAGERKGLEVTNGAEAVGEAALVRKRMELERVRRAQRAKVEEWVREVMLGRCWL